MLERAQDASDVSPLLRRNIGFCQSPPIDLLCDLQRRDVVAYDWIEGRGALESCQGFTEMKGESGVSVKGTEGFVDDLARAVGWTQQVKKRSLRTEFRMVLIIDNLVFSFLIKVLPDLLADFDGQSQELRVLDDGGRVITRLVAAVEGNLGLLRFDAASVESPTALHGWMMSMISCEC